MNRKLNNRSGRHGRERGFSLITAIFLVVIFAILTVFITTLGGVQHTTVATSLQAARAYQAARSGIEWGVRNALNPVGCFASPSAVDVTGAPGMSNFTVSVSCSSTPHREGSTDLQVFVITSTASWGAFGEPAYVSRQIRVTATDAP